MGCRLLCFTKKTEMTTSHNSDEDSKALKAIGWVSVGVGAVALGVYIGRELRIRYKFKHRTPYDYYSHYGDESQNVEYGMGI